MPGTWIQLCGPLAVQIQGARLESQLPSKQGKLLFAYLVLNRTRHIERDELLDVLWAQMLPLASESSLNALISKLRKALGTEVLQGRTAIHIALDHHAFIDLEAARDGLHRAEAALSRKDWGGVYSASNVAQKVGRRKFLLGLGDDSPWVEDMRRQNSQWLLRALEYEATACLHIGGGELRSAETDARELIDKAPYRETGYRLLMETLARQGNHAEALLVFEKARTLFREELGADPGPELQELHSRLLGG